MTALHHGLPIPALPPAHHSGSREGRSYEGGERGEARSGSTGGAGGEGGTRDESREAGAAAVEPVRGRGVGERASEQEHSGALVAPEGREEAFEGVGGEMGSGQEREGRAAASATATQGVREGEGTEGEDSADGRVGREGGNEGVQAASLGSEQLSATDRVEALREGVGDGDAAEVGGAEEMQGGGVRVEVVEALVPGIDFCNHGEREKKEKKGLPGPVCEVCMCNHAVTTVSKGGVKKESAQSSSREGLPLFRLVHFIFSSDELLPLPACIQAVGDVTTPVVVCPPVIFKGHASLPRLSCHSLIFLPMHGAWCMSLLCLPALRPCARWEVAPLRPRSDPPPSPSPSPSPPTRLHSDTLAVHLLQVKDTGKQMHV